MTRIVHEGQRHRVEPVKLPSLAARTFAGLVAALGLCVLLVGVPVLLLVGFGWPPPWPSRMAWDHPHLFTDEFLIAGLVLAAWAAWAWLVFIVARETVRAVRWGVDPAHLRDAASPVRWIAGALIGAVATLWPATAHAAIAPPAETTTGLQLDHDDLAASTVATPATTANSQPAAAAVSDAEEEQEIDPATGLRVVTVGPEDPTLWDIAEKYLGDPMRYNEIFELNKDRAFEGGPLNNPAHILDGWELLIPDTDQAPDADPATGLRVVTVGPENPTLWDMAKKHLGDPTRYMEIYELNKDRTFEGGPFDNPDELQDGWQLLLPDTDTSADEGPAETETPPAPPDGEGEVYEPPTIDPAVPDEGSSGTDDEEPDSTVPETPASDSESEREDGGLAAAFPFGVWLTAGTCLAAGTVFAIALRLRRRRTAPDAGGQGPVADEVMSGRLSDLEAIIETEARKLAQVVPEPQAAEAPIVAEPVVAVDTDRAPVTLSDLAATGVGLRGPGQRGAARAAILTAVGAGARVLITEAADLRLELGAAAASDQVQFTAEIDDALDTADGGDTVVVCADTDLDEATRPTLERFLTPANRSAFILGDWIPSSLVLEADGTVKAAHGRSAGARLRSLHIADLDTTAAVLAGLASPDHTDTEDDVVPELTAPDSTTRREGEPQDTVTPAVPPAGEEPGPLLRLCLFGQADVYAGEQPVQLKKGRRALRFLTVLALADEPVALGDLLAGVLDDQYDAAKAKNNLNTIGSATRVNLQAATGTKHKFYAYDQRTETYALEGSLFTTDVAEFDQYEQEAALSADPEDAVRSLEAAVALYTGDLAPDIDTGPVRVLRDQYRAAAARACRRLADHHRDGGDGTRADHYSGQAAKLEAGTRS
jgi:nucleoid-associated protein YgaU